MRSYHAYDGDAGTSSRHTPTVVLFSLDKHGNKYISATLSGLNYIQANNDTIPILSEHILIISGRIT